MEVNMATGVNEAEHSQTWLNVAEQGQMQLNGANQNWLHKEREIQIQMLYLYEDLCLPLSIKL